MKAIQIYDQSLSLEYNLILQRQTVKLMLKNVDNVSNYLHCI